MSSHVIIFVPETRELKAAQIAVIGSFACVDTLVDLQIIPFRKDFTASIALKSGSV